MQLCDKHQAELRAALIMRGLARFITEGASTKELVHRVLHHQHFEPLIRCQVAIINGSGINYGLKLADANANGLSCPICEALQRCNCQQGTGCPWNTVIDETAAAEMMYARSRGFLPSGMMS